MPQQAAKKVLIVGEEDIPVVPASELVLGKYDIIDPATVKSIPRSEFLQGLCGVVEDGQSIENIIAAFTAEPGLEMPKYELSRYASYYIELVSKGARLPKFTRWVTSMWADNKEFARIMADEGQKAVKRQVQMSVDPIDILRCAATPHFYSCFKWDTPRRQHRDARKVDREAFDRLPATILEECPGIGLMYVNDDKGMIMGRQWMHHARLKDSGEDILVLTDRPYGCLRSDYVAKLLAQRGVRVGITAYGNAGNESIEYVGCFDKSIHHDVATWDKNAKCNMVYA